MKDKIHVLLIEDNPGDARLVKGMLEHGEKSAFTVEHVSTLAEGIRSLRPDSGNRVILLDLGLPDETGLQTLRRVMPLAQDASVVVITGLQDEELGVAAIREGAHDYLIKGQVDGGRLRRLLRYAVERQKMQSDLRAEMERRARVQEALQLSEQRYRLLSETAPMGILISDELGRVVDANTQALHMFGYERGELIGESIETLVPERLRYSHQGHRSGYVKEPHARPMGVGMELFARRKDGTEFPVEIGLGPLATKEGVLVSSIIVDITTRKKMEEQLRLSQRMEAIGKLAGGVAHDFNNLLGVILGCSDAVQEALPPDHLAAKKVEMIRKASTDNISLTISLEPSLGCICADPGQIEQVLLNLAVNARDAMPKGGRLSIEARNADLDESYKQEHKQVIPGRYVMIAVEDSGNGMNRETQARIFDPFFTTKDLGKGTGLGLATVYGIVTQSGGYIWVYSEVGRGTIFKVYLPRVEQSERSSGPRESDTSSLQGSETILLAEDSESLREIARDYLETVGYKVIEAASGKEALQLACDFAGPIHLLLTDVVMPEMSGPELASQITSLRPGIKVIFTSGYTDDAIAREGVLDPGVTFIQKPYRPKALARKIREVLGVPDQKDESPAPSYPHTSGVT